MILLVALTAYVVAMTALVVISDKEIKQLKKEALGYNKKAVDRDGDGIVQEGTKWERKVSKKGKK